MNMPWHIQNMAKPLGAGTPQMCGAITGTGFGATIGKESEQRRNS